jgi:hypothetical protein
VQDFRLYNRGAEPIAIDLELQVPAGACRMTLFGSWMLLR